MSIDDERLQKSMKSPIKSTRKFNTKTLAFSSSENFEFFVNETPIEVQRFAESSFETKRSKIRPKIEPKSLTIGPIERRKFSKQSIGIVETKVFVKL